jgi:hypothetical protein
MIKICKKCKVDKETSEFYSHKEYKDGFMSICKSCEKERSRNNNLKYKDKIVQRRLQEDKSLRKERKKVWYLLNKDKEKANIKAYRLKNKHKLSKTINAWYLHKRQTDNLFKLKCNIRSAVRSAFLKHGYVKNSKTIEIVGCSLVELSKHLIQTAKQNYGKHFPKRPYEIDHIVPVSSANTEEELIKLNHYTNLQLLYPLDNKRKSNKLDWSIDNIRFENNCELYNSQEDMDVQDSKEKPSS